MSELEKYLNTLATTVDKNSAAQQKRCVCELLHRYHLGQILPYIRARLAEIFKDDPPDAWQRLLSACNYIGITGDELEQVAHEVMIREKMVN